jgi:hypothetical protein
LFVIPVPVIDNASGTVLVFGTVIVKALAPELNTMLLTSVVAESETAVLVDVAKVAVFDGPLGTVNCTQLLALFQLPEAGLAFHVALPANALPTDNTRMATTIVGKRRGRGVRPERRLCLFIVCYGRR